MTFTIQAVNELIQSLESAGELSIKDRKYLDVMRWAIRVAGERDAALNAERVWEKTMMEACGEDGPASVASEIRSLRALRDTAIQALKSQVEQLAAENVGLKAAIDATIGWQQSTDVENVESVRMLLDINTPVTDRIVDGIKADEEKAVLNDLLRHLDKIDIGNISSPWELSSEVVAFVNSRLLREGAK